MRTLLAAAIVMAAAPAFADSTSGTVLSLDSTRNALTLTDRTVWFLPSDTVLPEALAKGDAIRITYISNADNGWQKITFIERTKG